MSDWLVMATARNWVASVVHQGNRVLELQARTVREHETPEQFFAWARERQVNPDFTHVEDHLFVTTVHKSVEWILEAHKRNLLEPELSAPFLTAADQASVVRNIREHYLKYLNGGGWQREENVVTIDINDGASTATIDATSVIVTNEGRLIGGRINVQVLMREADALHPLLLQQQNVIGQRESQRD
ncbi:hypothetical protein HWD96_25110 [Pseudomonas putida]|uniref:hypothetical protein n=1 Tax=Pseudomonas putida TaxID=303 RepID=UPI001F51C143|nr:hypothetical protein [Pseudomonas putida]MCI1025502.1 hypothetical protein [Pseudomonas putida]